MAPRLLQRLLPATGVALAVAILGFGVIGLAVADGGEEGFPTSFRLAERHGGDKGVYQIVDEHLGEGGERREYDDRFFWSEEQPFMDGRDGTWQAVHARRTDSGLPWGYQESPEGSYVPVPVWWVDWVESATGRTVGVSSLLGLTTTSLGPLLGDLNPVSSAERTMALNAGTHWQDDEGCDLETLLRAGVRLDAPIRLPESCTEPGEDPSVYTASPGEVDGMATVKFEETYVGDGWSSEGATHYVASLPEPVREEWTYSEQGVLLWHYTATLTGFEHGAGPWVAGIELPPPVDLPPIEVAPRDPWGPSEAGVEHPYPASQAWAEARDDPTFTGFRDYLAAHPGAMAARGDYHEEREGNQTHRSWMFIIHADATSGDGKFMLFATQTTGPAGAAAADLLGLPLQTGVPTTTSDHTGTEWTDQGEPGPLPTSMPTLASVMARWQAQTGSTAAANGWSFDVDQVTAGQAGVDMPTPRAQDLVMGGQRQGRASFLQLAVAHDGTPWALVQEERSASNSNVGLTGAPPGKVPPPSPQATAWAGMVWTLPSGPVASGTVAVSLLAGLIYWLWPFVKSGAVGLFSRIQGPKVLQNPRRARILDAIAAEPGIHFSELLRRTGVGNGSLHHHLKVLRDAGRVEARAAQGYTCYFPAGAPQAVVLGAAAAKADGAQRILGHVRAHPGRSVKEVAMECGLHPSTVTYHVQRLCEAGLVDALRDGREVRLHGRVAA